jgi:hypothetical protein
VPEVAKEDVPNPGQPANSETPKKPTQKNDDYATAAAYCPACTTCINVPFLLLLYQHTQKEQPQACSLILPRQTNYFKKPERTHP